MNNCKYRPTSIFTVRSASPNHTGATAHQTVDTLVCLSLALKNLAEEENTLTGDDFAQPMRTPANKSCPLSQRFSADCHPYHSSILSSVPPQFNHLESLNLLLKKLMTKRTGRWGWSSGGSKEMGSQTLVDKMFITHKGDWIVGSPIDISRST